VYSSVIQRRAQRNMVSAPDMFSFRDMLMMLARNKKVDEAEQVWQDLKREEVLFDQHTFGDITRAFLDNGFSDRGDGHI